MKDLDHVLQSNATKYKAENSRFERLEQFKGIRADERNKMTINILNAIPEYAEDINGKPMISVQDLTEVLEKLRKGE